MKIIKKLVALVSAAVILLCFFSFSAAAKSKYPEPTSNFFVNDFANCISNEDESTMQALGEKLYKETKAQVVVVAVENLNGNTIEDYSIGLAREWKIGEEDKDTGVLLILSVSDRKVRIEVGYGLEGRITDGKTGRILDTYAMPYLKNNDFSTGLREAYKVLIEETYAELGVEGYTTVEDNYSDDYEEDLSAEEVVIAIAVVLFIIVFSIGRRFLRGTGFYGGGGFFGGGGGFSGGGFSSGSGGSSFGGGGGGFSGGGGSFGGGGGSRGF